MTKRESQKAREYLMHQLCDCIRDRKFRASLPQRGWNNLADLMLQCVERRSGRPKESATLKRERARMIWRQYKSLCADGVPSTDAYQSLASDHGHNSGDALARWLREHR